MTKSWSSVESDSNSVSAFLARRVSFGTLGTSLRYAADDDAMCPPG